VPSILGILAGDGTAVCSIYVPLYTMKNQLGWIKAFLMMFDELVVANQKDQPTSKKKKKKTSPVLEQ
jgi:hypothetical protein